MLTINDLHVSINNTLVLKGVSMHIAAGETFILFGPNGSGKTTLLMSIMGFSDYVVEQGQIIFKGRDITHAPMYERARLGMGMSFQRPPTIPGLPTRKMVALCAQGEKIDVVGLARQVNFERFLDRDINSGFSGGEIKRSEMLQLLAQQPSFMLFDEPESGVDLENMALIGRTAKALLDGSAGCNQDLTMKQRLNVMQRSGLIITHTGYILEYVNADRAQVMFDGRLCCEARPREILEHIAKYGYQECMRCFASDALGSIHPSYTFSR